MLSVPLVDTRDLGLYGNRRMLVFKDKQSKKLTYAIVEAFADTAYLKRNGYQFNDSDFTGTLLFHDLEKGFETGFVLKDGKPVGDITALKEFDEEGNLVQSTTPAGARKKNCILTIYEKCYGTKYQDPQGQWIYHLSSCYADRVERSPSCEENYWPIWKNYVDFYDPGSAQQSTIAKESFLSNKLTVSMISRECIHQIIQKLMGSANSLSRLGSILQASQLSYDFYKFVGDLTSPQTDYKIYVTEGQLNPNVNAQTSTNGSTITITLNKSYLSQATDLAVARTLTHELIHAYLIVGQSNPSSYGPAFQSVKYYLDNYVGSDNQVHHNLMAHEYRTTISSMLDNYAAVTDTNIPSPLGPMEEYTAKMAWQGLQGSGPYNALSDAEKQAIITVLTNEATRAPNSSNKKGC